ncbi:MAG: hypothetical protein ABFE01_12385, partial [Phycisphaerales bacterium]
MRRMTAILPILVWCVAGPTRAVDFAGGTGEPNDPYQIATFEQLLGVSSDYRLFEKHFVLIADIDLDPNLPGRRVFREPVLNWPFPRYSMCSAAEVDPGYSFSGSFDGGGHAIRNCVIVCASPGFFSGIAPKGVVRNLRMENMAVLGIDGFHCGSMTAGNGGLIVGCSVNGTFTAQAGGALVGFNTGSVIGCRMTGVVFGDSVGGMVGVNLSTGRLLLSEFDGLLYGDSSGGGLAGTNEGGTIQYCTSAGFISSAHTGGLVAGNRGIIRECYVAATVGSGGGLAYSNDGTISNCYMKGSVLGESSDGLVATNAGAVLSSYSVAVTRIRSGSNVRSAYYLDSGTTEGQTSSPPSGCAVALSPAQMTRASSFVGFDFYGDASDGPGDHWFKPSQGYPILTWQNEITGLTVVPVVSELNLEQARSVFEYVGLKLKGVRHDYSRPRAISSTNPRGLDTAGEVVGAYPMGYLQLGFPIDIVVGLGEYDFSKNPGDGYKENPFRIETAGQLDSLGTQSILWDRHFELTADIDQSGYAYSDH